MEKKVKYQNPMCWPICLLAIFIFYIQRFPYFNFVCTNLCHLLTAFTNGLDPDQAGRFVGADPVFLEMNFRCIKVRKRAKIRN